jgi:plasmid stabilization system protein ParE
MKFQVITMPRAEADLEAACAWIQKYSPQRAARWYQGICAAIQSLDSMPHRCSLAPESEGAEVEIRQLLYGKRRGIYRILFTVVGNEVRVLHVRHGAQRLLEP